jgi:hypothetical protein
MTPRGFEHLPDSVYDGVIKRFLDQSARPDAEPGKVVVAAWNPILNQLAPHLIRHEGTRQLVGFEEDAHIFQVLKNLPITADEQDLLLRDPLKIVFIEGLDQAVTAKIRGQTNRRRKWSGAHYSTKRHQIYLDTKYLNPAASRPLLRDFHEKLHHELVEHHLVAVHGWSAQTAHEWLADARSRRLGWRRNLNEIQEKVLHRIEAGGMVPTAVNALLSRIKQLRNQIKKSALSKRNGDMPDLAIEDELFDLKQKMTTTFLALTIAAVVYTLNPTAAMTGLIGILMAFQKHPESPKRAEDLFEESFKLLTKRDPSESELQRVLFLSGEVITRMAEFALPAAAEMAAHLNASAALFSLDRVAEAKEELLSGMRRGNFQTVEGATWLQSWILMGVIQEALNDLAAAAAAYRRVIEFADQLTSAKELTEEQRISEAEHSLYANPEHPGYVSQIDIVYMLRDQARRRLNRLRSVPMGPSTVLRAA